MTPLTAYQGGKQRLAKAIVDIIKPSGRFFDLCCGSGAVSVELVGRGHDPHLVTMADCGPWGLVWQAVGAGTFDLAKFKAYCSSVPRDKRLVKGFMEELSRRPADVDVPYVFLLLQSSSFGSKAIWIKDNRWRNTTFRSFWEPTATSSRRSHVNPMMPQPDTLYARAEVVCERMRGVAGYCCDVRDLTPDGVVYIDPPYTGSTRYGHTLDVLPYARSLGRPCYVSEGRPLSGDAHLLSAGSKKGGISGSRAEAHQEWLSLL